jgi:putative membrane protein
LLLFFKTMAKTLILNIDRDDDFGRKAQVKSPIIGVKNNLDAANKLGLIDPEDSDLNAIFFAISIYETLKKEAKDIEIATLCGDINIGVKSDQKLSEQLDIVIQETNAENAILITDGAEDEYILPIIQSRLKINSIQRVNVKQSKQLEDTYYRIIKLLDEDKVKKQFFLPIALILIVWAFFAIFGMAASGFGAILFTLGIYLLIRTFNSEKKVAVVWHEFRAGLLTGRPSFYTSIIALVIITVSMFYAYNNTFNQYQRFLDVLVLKFLAAITWGIVAAGLLAAFGRVTDLYIREKKILWTYWTVPFSLFAFGFIGSILFDTFGQVIWEFRNDRGFLIEPFYTLSFWGYITVGIIIVFIGAVSYHYIKEEFIDETYEVNIEEQTQKLLKNHAK